MKSIAWLVAGLLGIAGWAPIAGAQTKLLLSTFFPQSHPLYSQVLQPWARDLEKAGNGLTIEFSPSSLAPPPGQLDLVAKGIADVSIQYAGVVPNRLQLLLMTEVPGASSGTAEAMSVALWRTQQKFFQAADEHKGLKLLALVVFPLQDFYGVKEPLIVDFVEQPPGKAPTGETVATPFFEIKYDFVLQKAAAALAAAE